MLAEKGGVDAMSVVAFAYDTYTNSSSDSGELRARITKTQSYAYA